MKLVVAPDHYGFAGEHFWLGLSASVVSALAFGSMFVPIKRRNLGDGMLVQWLQCAAILMCGFVVLVIRLFPGLSAMAILAGCIWAVGNMFTIPIVNRLGIGLGNMVRGSVQIVVGWATARFGLLGLAREQPRSDFLEYFGVSLTVLCAVLFALVEPHVEEDDEKSMLLDQLQLNNPSDPPDRSFTRFDSVSASEGGGHGDSWWRRHERVVKGCALAVISGLFFGEQLTPLTYAMERRHAAMTPWTGLDYAFSFALGAFLTSTVFTIAYVWWKKIDQSLVDKSLILPGLAYGAMWSVAMFSWFVSNATLSQSISFPITSRMPNLVVTAWGVFVYGEVRGRRDLSLLAVASAIAVVGVVCVAMANRV